MKAKKRERQEAKRAEMIKQKQEEYYKSLKVVSLKPINNHSIQYHRTFSWACPDCKGSFTYSQEINDKWGHPHNLVFCGVCCRYHRIDCEEAGLVFESNMCKTEVNKNG